MFNYNCFYGLGKVCNLVSKGRFLLINKNRTSQQEQQKLWKNTNLVTIVDGLFLACKNQGNFLAIWRGLINQKEPICGAGEKPEDEHDRTKLLQFTSRMINCCLWMIS